MLSGLSRVSVVIPNYNHALYLPQRIESVLQQSYAPSEVIILDDCSSDNSRTIIEHYASIDNRICAIYNEQNSGSTFKQWNKGISLAQGEYVWLAESDDYASPELLASLVLCLDINPDVGLAYCDSFSVDEKGELMPVSTWEPVLAELDANLWKKDFTQPGIELVRRFMSYRNIIPNASAVLLRRSTLEMVGQADESFRILGDLLFWAKILAVSDVSFVARPLNYFRTHRNNVRSQTLMNGTALLETSRMLLIMKQYGKPADEFYQLAINSLVDFWMHAIFYYKVPLSRHQAIYQNMALLEPRFGKKIIKDLFSYLFSNRFGGIKSLIKVKLLYSLLKEVK